MRDDPYSFVTALLGYILGQTLGSLIAPHMLIVIASASGAMIALGRRDKTKEPKGWQFIFVVVAAAFCFTSLGAYFAAQYLGIQDPRTVFAPVAFLIGFIGLDYDEAWKFCYNIYAKFRGLPRENQNG